MRISRWLWLLAFPLGAAIGLGVAALDQPTSIRINQSRPLIANDPAIPADEPLLLLEDPDTPPPLALGVATRRVRVGGRLFPLFADVPTQWTRVDLGTAEARWLLPGNPANAYFLRVENVLSERLTLQQAIDNRVQALRASADEFTLIYQTENTIKFSWVSDRHLRVSYVRWFDPRAEGFAYAEVSVVGRQVDDAGMRALLDQINVGVVGR